MSLVKLCRWEEAAAAQAAIQRLDTGWPGPFPSFANTFALAPLVALKWVVVVGGATMLSIER